MNKAVRVVLTILLAPLMPWAAYWTAFAGMNIPHILAGEEVIHYASPTSILAVSLLSAVVAIGVVLFGHLRKPKALL